MELFRPSLLVACFLLYAGLAQNCERDPSFKENQGLDFASAPGRVTVHEIEGVSDPQSCWKKCCESLECDVAMMGYPMDGEPQCTLINCHIKGQDGCAFRSSSDDWTQFKVYRKKGTGERNGKHGNGLHVEPLMGSIEPRIDERNESNSVLCRQPKKVGSCRAAFTRFYYDPVNQSCKSFIYGGCEANDNNFHSQEDCEASCSGVTGSVLPDESTPAPPPVPVKAVRMAPAVHTGQRKQLSKDAEGPTGSEPAASTQKKEMSAKDFAVRCGAEPVVGPCRAAFKRWYYNAKTGSCESFIYGGCKGNANNYHNENDCVAACTVTVLPSSKKIAADDAYSQEFRDKCIVKPDAGPCRAAFSMFYYDRDAGTCQSFIYGGCRGNNNRYSTMAECLDNCSQDDGLHVFVRSENRWTAGLFLFITLATISGLLLVALVIMLRRRNAIRRTPSISDKQELLPDEQSSVDSLTLPDSPKADKA